MRGIKPKEYLSQIRRLNTMIEQKQKERDSLRDIDGVSGIDMSKDPVQTSPNGSAPFERTIERILTLEDEIDKLIAEYITKRNRIIEEIHALDNTNYIELLFKRYVECKSFELIAVEMNYTYDWIREMHGHALLAFERTHTNPQRPVLQW